MLIDTRVSKTKHVLNVLEAVTASPAATPPESNVCGGEELADKAAGRAMISHIYGVSSASRSVFQLVNTALPLAALWLLMQQSLAISYWLTLLMSVPAAGLVVRLFMIQHDCGHHSFFRRSWLNDVVGRIIGIVTLTPYDEWRLAHAHHHASSGNLERRGIGDVDLLTVAEYRSLGAWRKFLYRVYRTPAAMFLAGPAYLFVFKHRFAARRGRGSARSLASVAGTNVAIVVLAGAGMYFFGVAEFLKVQIPITLIASLIGLWLFYIQHQFERTYWEPGRTWTFAESALHGSSHYRLPAILRWFTANIGLHHIHHFCSQIPNYHLAECLADNPALEARTQLTFWQSLRCGRLALWDEDRKRLVAFNEIN